MHGVRGVRGVRDVRRARGADRPQYHQRNLGGNTFEVFEIHIRLDEDNWKLLRRYRSVPAGCVTRLSLVQALCGLPYQALVYVHLLRSWSWAASLSFSTGK